MLSQRIGLYLRQEIRWGSPIVGLSPLELELLLDKSLKEVKNFHEKNPKSGSKNPPKERTIFGMEVF